MEIQIFYVEWYSLTLSVKWLLNNYLKHNFENSEIRHVHEYQPLFEGIVAKWTVVNKLSIIINSEQN